MTQSDFHLVVTNAARTECTEIYLPIQITITSVPNYYSSFQGFSSPCLWPIINLQYRIFCARNWAPSVTEKHMTELVALYADIRQGTRRWKNTHAPTQTDRYAAIERPELC